MQFHEYLTLRNQTIQHGTNEEFHEKWQQMSSEEFRNKLAMVSGEAISRSQSSHEVDIQQKRLVSAIAERVWCENKRPFYNIWPIAVELAQQVKLDLLFSAVRVPFDSLLLRFARGHEPHSVKTAMIFWPALDEFQNVVHIYWFLESGDRIQLEWRINPDDCVESWLTNMSSGVDAHSFLMGSLMVRLLVFVGLLANDHDMITSVVLAKDRNRYQSTDDHDVQKWLEERAVRRMGRGFDVGKQLNLAREKSPHWRNPHLALFWTGPGRTRPIIKMRSGSIIQRVSMAEVPTGYLGPETVADDTLPLKNTRQDAPVSNTKRFEIMKRDGYRCKLCGSSQDDDVKLHVDHKVPRAKGGSNENDNLWTLCDRCNHGKSDKDL